MYRVTYTVLQTFSGVQDASMAPVARPSAPCAAGARIACWGLAAANADPWRLQKWSSSAVFFILLPFAIGALVDSSSHFTCGSPAESGGHVFSTPFPAPATDKS